MIRVAGVNINPKKQARFALTPIRGIGKNNVKALLVKAGIKPTDKLGDLDEEIIVQLRNILDSDYLLESDLRRQHQADIKHLIDVSSWRGARHTSGLPVRGQTTKVNSRTRRSKKRGAGTSGKPKATK